MLAGRISPLLKPPVGPGGVVLRTITRVLLFFRLFHASYRNTVAQSVVQYALSFYSYTRVSILRFEFLFLAPRFIIFNKNVFIFNRLHRASSGFPLTLPGDFTFFRVVFSERGVRMLAGRGF